MPSSAQPCVRQLLQQARTQMDGWDAEILLVHALERDRAWLFAHADAVPDARSRTRFDELVARRTAGEPVAYLTGHRGFWTLDLDVTPATLIPRPETEVLVEQALQILPADQPCTIADLGTGSGAVALSIASERSRASLVATDASAAALAVARCNAERLGLANVTFLEGDWLQPLAERAFDLIVSNPPYVADGDPHLTDLQHEPAAALTSGSDGLDAIRTIVRDARTHLVPDGWLLFEHGWQQGDAARALLCEAGYTGVRTWRDLEDRDRVSGGCLSMPL